MNEVARQALDAFRHEQALSIHHARKAEGHLSQFLSLIGRQPSEVGSSSGSSVRCVREFTRWLSINGPGLKAIIESDTGVKFTERGTPHTFVWDDAMADDPDDALPPNTLMRMQRKLPDSPPGRGAPPAIYFLWSQRFDVRPRFGVGPERPAQSNIDPDPVMEHGGFLSGFPDDATNSPQVSENPDPEPKATVARYATLAEWDEAWASSFDALASAEAKATDAQKELFRATLPEGEDANAAIAIAYRQATQRVQQGLLGVVQPPPEDITTWEGETDPRGWEQEPLPPA